MRSACLLLVLTLLAAACSGNTPAADQATATPTATASEVSEDDLADALGTPTPAVAEEETTPEPEPPEPTSDTAFSEVPCRFEMPAGREARCGDVEVPENRRDADNDNTIKLHVAVFESTARDPVPDPVIYLDGGPGGKTLETLQFTFDDLFAPLLERRDVIVFDQRGVGWSQPALDCPGLTTAELEQRSAGAAEEDVAAAVLAAAEQCRAALSFVGVDLAAYHSAESADDVDDIRQALGYEQLNLLGISYGTRLAQNVVRQHPDGVRTVVLDSAYSLDDDLLLGVPASSRRSFGLLFERCNGDPDCAATFPDLEPRLRAVVEALDAAPAVVPIESVGVEYNLPVDGDMFTRLVFNMLYSRDLFVLVPRLVAELEVGNTRGLEGVAALQAINSEFLTAGKYLSVVCHEEVPFWTPDLVTASLTGDDLYDRLVDGVSGASTTDLCEVWSAGTAPAEENAAVESDIPVLVLAGAFDPITPPESSQQAAAGFDTAIFDEQSEEGHGVSLTTCGIRLVELFLQFTDLFELEQAGSCRATPLDWVPEPLDEVALTRFEVDAPFSATGLRPATWTEQQPGVYARGAVPLVDPTALVVMFFPDVTAAAVLDQLRENPQLGVLGDPPDINLTDVSWQVLEFIGSETHVAIALTERDGGTLLVELDTWPEEHEALRAAVWGPAVRRMTFS